MICRQVRAVEEGTAGLLKLAPTEYRAESASSDDSLFSRASRTTARDYRYLVLPRRKLETMVPVLECLCIRSHRMEGIRANPEVSFPCTRG